MGHSPTSAGCERPHAEVTRVPGSVSNCGWHARRVLLVLGPGGLPKLLLPQVASHQRWQGCWQQGAPQTLPPNSAVKLQDVAKGCQPAPCPHEPTVKKRGTQRKQADPSPTKPDPTAAEGVRCCCSRHPIQPLERLNQFSHVILLGTARSQLVQTKVD